MIILSKFVVILSLINFKPIVAPRKTLQHERVLTKTNTRDFVGPTILNITGGSQVPGFSFIGSTDTDPMQPTEPDPVTTTEPDPVTLTEPNPINTTENNFSRTTEDESSETYIYPITTETDTSKTMEPSTSATKEPSTSATKEPDSLKTMESNPRSTVMRDEIGFGEVLLIIGIAFGVFSGTLYLLILGKHVAFNFKNSIRPKKFGSDSENGRKKETAKEDFNGDACFAVAKKEFDTACSIGWYITRNKFKIEDHGRPCGNGNFGIVYKGQLRPTVRTGGHWEDVAIKVIQWRDAGRGVKESFYRELRTYQRIKEGNNNIVRFLGSSCDPDGLYILTEFCEGGSLDKELAKLHLQVFGRTVRLPPPKAIDVSNSYLENDVAAEIIWMEKTKPNLTPNELQLLLGWCAQIACGMECLHSKQITHTDLAPNNILLRRGIIKICDFGLSKDFVAQSYLEGGFPFHSFAPELNFNKPTGHTKITAHVDIWAFGCTVYQIFTLGDPLYPTINVNREIEVLQAVSNLLISGYRHPAPTLDPGYVYRVLLQCWDEVPQKRPGFTHLRRFFHDKWTMQGPPSSYRLMAN